VPLEPQEGCEEATKGGSAAEKGRPPENVAPKDGANGQNDHARRRYRPPIENREPRRPEKGYSATPTADHLAEGRAEPVAIRTKGSPIWSRGERGTSGPRASGRDRTSDRSTPTTEVPQEGASPFFGDAPCAIRRVKQPRRPPKTRVTDR